MRFEELEVWKRAARLSATLYQETAGIKDWGFRDQVTRSGLSIPSKIAEGYERDSSAEIARFLTIAKGSAGELVTQRRTSSSEMRETRNESESADEIGCERSKDNG